MVFAAPWNVLGVRGFRALWLATVVSNIGTTMHDVAAAWLMTSLSRDPLQLALLQAAGSLPLCLFLLPSGALADILDRRRYLVFAQLWMLAVAVLLGAVALRGLVTPAILMVANFLLGLGAAMAAPALQSMVPDLVGREATADASALNSLGMNLSRAIGPALGGLALTAMGPGVVFLLNAASVTGMLVVLLAHRPAQQGGRLPPESFGGALLAGLRYVRAAPLLQHTLLHVLAFFPFASAAWALLPLVARERLGLDAGGYGGLLACMGGGAVVGALLLPRLRSRFTADGLLGRAGIVFALVLVTLALPVRPLFAACVLGLGGVAWIVSITVLAGSAQRASATWVKSRAMAVYLAAFFGAMTLGSIVWGSLARYLGIGSTLVIAGLALLLATLAAGRLLIHGTQALDLSPAQPHLHQPETGAEIPAHTRGRVLVTIEYRIALTDRAAFRQAIHAMRHVRMRGGAINWAVYEDTRDPGRHLEVFALESWLDHLRQHEHFSANDHALHARVLAFHQGNNRPVVTHLVSYQGGMP
jgi:MFS family permease